MQEKDAIEDREILNEPAEVTEPNLMLNRVLVASKIIKDDWRRHNLFRTICSAGGKFCSIIIDSGSMKNYLQRDG